MDVRLLLCVCLVSVLAGCTSGGFEKTEMFAEYGANGETNYYRVLIKAEGCNGVINYRSGWYDAVAVDSLFGNVSERATTNALTAARRRKAIQRTFDSYMTALEKPETDAAITAAKNRYTETLQNLTGVTSLGEKPQSVLDHASDKFVIIFSSNPDLIIESIKGKSQELSVSKSLERVLGARRQSDAATNRLRLKLLAAQIEGLKGSLDTQIAAIGGTDDLSVIKTAIDGLLAELEAVR